MSEMLEVDAITAVARETLRQVLDGAPTVALVNFPNHGNPGDPAIWLGSRTLLRDLGVRIAYSSAWWDFDPAALRRAAGDAPVLINGGGNLGDLYAGQQGTRAEVLRSLRDNRIIQLPQSIHFASPENADAMGLLISEHGGFELMVREKRSLGLAHELFGVDAILSPDHALGLRELQRSPRARKHPILWLARRPGDPEYVPYDEPADMRVTRREWLEGVGESEREWDRRGRVALKINAAARHRRLHGPEPRMWRSSVAHHVVSMTYPILARRWVARGVDMLTDAEVVITDKLHGHLLCVLLGLDHVVLDNSYGKVSGTLDAWTGALSGVHRAVDGHDAMAQALAILEAR